MAAGQTLVSFTAADARFTDNVADTGRAWVGLRNENLVLEFPDTGTHYAHFEGRMPRTFIGNIDCYVHWTATSGVSGFAGFRAGMERWQEDVFDMDGTTWTGASNLQLRRPAPVSGVIVRSKIPDLAKDAVALGEHFKLRFWRLGSGSTDTMVGHMQVHHISLVEAPA